jgi:hypothetical protein
MAVLSFSRSEGISECSFGPVSEIASSAQTNSQIFLKRGTQRILGRSPHNNLAGRGAEAITVTFSALRPFTWIVAGLVNPRMYPCL